LAAGRIFLRDDDVFDDQDGLVSFCDALLNAGVPFTLGVIPGKLAPTCTRYLNHLMANGRSAELITIAQHGYLHKNNASPGKYSEFPDTRNPAEIEHDILDGWAIIEANLLPEFRLFIPPWNGFSRAGMAVLQRANYQALLSKSTYAVSKDHVVRIGTIVDVMQSYWPRELKPIAQVASEVHRAIQRMIAVGILTHHRMLGTEYTQALLSLVEHMARHREARIVSFPSLLK